MNEIKTYSDLWAFVCKGRNACDLLQFYTTDPNETAKAFWHGVLTTLELCGTITRERGFALWYAITGEKWAEAFKDC